MTGARECLVVTGSRSRDTGYLEAIETCLQERPALACYRVLFGPPHHQVLKDHLIRLLHLRDPGDRSLGFKTLHIGIVEDTEGSPERFFCASERMAVVPIPSLTSHEAFDSGVVLGIMHRCALLPWMMKTGSLTVAAGTGPGRAGVFVVGEAGPKVHSGGGGPPVVTVRTWTVRGRVLD